MKKKFDWLFISTLVTGLTFISISAKLFWDSACENICGMQHYLPGSGFVGGPCRYECNLEFFGNGFFWLGLVLFVTGVVLVILAMSKKQGKKK